MFCHTELPMQLLQLLALSVTLCCPCQDWAAPLCNYDEPFCPADPFWPERADTASKTPLSSAHARASFLPCSRKPSSTGSSAGLNAQASSWLRSNCSGGLMAMLTALFKRPAGKQVTCISATICHSHCMQAPKHATGKALPHILLLT